jgi:hypothetical protein
MPAKQAWDIVQSPKRWHSTKHIACRVLPKQNKIFKIETMGTDHTIIVANGYRIPIDKWHAFCQALLQPAPKAAEPDASTGEDGSDADDGPDMAYEIDVMEQSVSNTYTHGFVSQAGTTSYGYVLIYENRNVEWIMSQKIGGALAWSSPEFEHMHGVNTLNFSIRVDYPEERAPAALLAAVPPLLRIYLETLPVAQYYNRWLFSYAH